MIQNKDKPIHVLITTKDKISRMLNIPEFTILRKPSLTTSLPTKDIAHPSLLRQSPSSWGKAWAAIYSHAFLAHEAVNQWGEAVLH